MPLDFEQRTSIQKIRRGVYRHTRSGQLIVKTTGWDGPRAGHLAFWEIADDNNGEVIIGGWLPFYRLRDAVKHLETPS